MGPQLAEDLLSSYRECYETFEDYTQKVESAFLDDEELSGKDLHRGKHFLAHGVVGMLTAEQDHLFGLLNNQNSSPATSVLSKLHENCTEAIRELHDSVNRLSNSEVDPEKRSQQPRIILRHLHEIDAFLKTIVDLAEELYTADILDKLPRNESEELISKFNQALEEDRVCSRHR